ncbi:MAG: arginine--tRNA ligase [Nitrososphaerota archaeon]|nr:arginine--tRNA ligase [Nitrososphaerota archaeon]MDG6929704.1 arginine--tRNA ligase [Nitrososphaerota archaeon]
MISYLSEINDIRLASENALKDIGLQVNFAVSETTMPSFGDITTNAAFVISKAKKIPPSDAIALFLVNFKPKSQKFLEVVPHTSGFVNFWLKTEFFNKFINEVIAQHGFGDIDVAQKKIAIEHTSVNPNKALHVGHARNVIIGDTFYRLLKRLGHRVAVLNYIDDTGVQVADLLIGFKEMGFSVDGDGQKYDHYCGDVVYVKANKVIENDLRLKEVRSNILKALEAGDETYKFANRIVSRIVSEQLKSAWALGARYDLLNWESHFLHAGYWNEVFDILKSKGAVQYVSEGKNAGCWVLKGKKVLIRSDGTAVYTAKDIIYAAWKLGIVNDRFGYDFFANQWDGTSLITTSLDKKGVKSYNPADISYIVIDQRQEPIQQMIKEVVEAVIPDKKYKIIAYGLVALSKNTAEKINANIENEKFVHMSGRSGVFFNLDDLYFMVKGAAMEIINKRNAPLENKERVAEGIAVSAIRYSLLKIDLDKQIVFDIDDAVKLEGDTGPYLQYSLARAMKIIEKLGPLKIPCDIGVLNSEEERALLLSLTKFDYELNKSYETVSLSTIANYAHELAVQFNIFYEKHRVIDEKSELVKNARGCLVLAFTYIMTDLFQVLGIPVLKEL